MAHERTIDTIIKWIERRIFHANGYNPPTEQDLHIWLNHTKKFKREQDNLKIKVAEQSQQRTQALGKLEDATKCDLCDAQAEYRQCQRCMNDKFVGSHTDEEYRKLEAVVEAAKELIIILPDVTDEEHKLRDALADLEDGK